MLLRSWTSILGGFLLYYVNPIYTHDGHDYSDREKSSIDRREELLKKWDQEVMIPCPSFLLNYLR